MKKIIALAVAALALTVVAVANRPVDMSSLEHLSALEETQLSGTQAAFTFVNEHALEVLPAAATLRAENAIAGIALRLASDTIRRRRPLERFGLSSSGTGEPTHVPIEPCEG